MYVEGTMENTVSKEKRRELREEMPSRLKIFRDANEQNKRIQKKSKEKEEKEELDDKEMQ